MLVLMLYTYNAKSLILLPLPASLTIFNYQRIMMVREDTNHGGAGDTFLRHTWMASA
jgi:hypothetical protein